MRNVILLLNLLQTWGQLINRAPHFVPGIGDMSKFSLKENTPVGTPVYQLKGMDPENSQLHYSISGQQFIVDRYTGVVTLKQPLDREQQDLIEVIISITDEGIAGSEPNTVSLRREITILDENDNPPVFHNRPYHANISEDAIVGSTVITDSEIIVTDDDEGLNADITISCYQSNDVQTDSEICSTFRIYTEKIPEGYKAQITLSRPLDYETRSTYLLTLMAMDSGSKPLKTFANLVIDVIDVQDQPPIFLNAPYSATIPENTAEGTSILNIRAKDGDIGNPRPLLLTIEDDKLGYFTLESTPQSAYSSDLEYYGVLKTSDQLLDREHPDILQNGGIYTFTIKATELINNELPADFTTTQITIVITDVDDQIPTFNQDFYEINVSEDISNDTPLPGLNMYVIDEDIGVNSRYTLELRNLNSSNSNLFDIAPKFGEGRTPIVIKVTDSSLLDYDVDDISLRTYQFEVVALVNGTSMSSATVIVHLTDANDNAPVFEQNSYRLHVAENSVQGLKISDITATDKDSGDYGKIAYFLRGFGSKKFSTNEKTGGIYVKELLDYEQQKSYSLTLEAIDGGGKVSSVNIFIEIDDINDNAPIFEQREYQRTIREGATSFEPQLFVRANDVDGPDQGGGKIFYSIVSTNSISENLNESNVFSIDSNTGEIKIERPVHSMDTPRGQYDLIVRATDGGVPPMSNDTRVAIRVGIAGNQRPIFKGNYNPLNIPLLPGTGLMHYKATIKETAGPNTNVTTVQATDPDGLDNLLNYFIAGGHKDNFVIDSKSGLITTSSYSNLDLETNPKLYNVIVYAVDNGLPVHETATSTVFINVSDVNNKPPMFNATNTTAYVSERAPMNSFVINIRAFDPDESAELKYSIVEPIKAKDKTGVAAKMSSKYDYKHAFKINENGDILVNNSLSYNSAAVIILTIRAEDLNAEIDPEKQVAYTEVTIFIQAYSDNNPYFVINANKYEKNAPIQQTNYDPTTQTVHLHILEEQPIGYKILNLEAIDPLTEENVSTFQLIHSGTDLFTVLQNGEIILTKRLDYEALDEKLLYLVVKAISVDNQRSSELKIYIHVKDINDNAPIFEQKQYKVSVRESSRYPEQILQVAATDLDDPNDDSGYGTIKYSLSGENSNYFVIDSRTGIIQLSPNLTLDRERQSVLRFTVIASDSPRDRPSEAQRTTAEIIVDVLDVNDNAPQFTMKSYIAVAAENVIVGTSVINLTATDPDEGLGGEVFYEILDEHEVKGLFQIDSRTGELTTKNALTGKGRTEPYLMTIRAQDEGGLYTDTDLTLYIGDISSNDGVPTFIRPTNDQIAYISENSTIGSPVFQVVATDPDDPSLPSGKLEYKLLNDGVDYLAFKIDPNSGLITTRVLLDREKKEFYSLVLVVQDKGDPPQQTTRVLQVQVTDVDDHKPHFIRGIDDTPLTFSIEEEVANETIVGTIIAEDQDIGENGEIDYIIISGNEHEWFGIERTNDSKGIIRTIRRIDREEHAQFLLTIKCFKASTRQSQTTRKLYNRLDPSEIQVLIKVIDIDDNRPMFVKDNVTIGVRLNVPVDTSILNLEANDIDPDALPIQYDILMANFTPLIDFGDKLNASDVFRLDENTGDLRTVKSLVNYVDGVFTLIVRANNSILVDHYTNTTVQIYIVRDRDMLKFIFIKPPAEVRKTLRKFEMDVQNVLEDPQIKLHVYDTQFNLKRDNSLDFSSTSSCFQLIGPTPMSTNEMMNILNNEKIKDKLDTVYRDYNIVKVDTCSQKSLLRTEATRVQLWVLIIATFIGIAAFIASCTLCCLHRRYKLAVKRSFIKKEQLNTARMYPSTATIYAN
ncbi:cadherin-23 [Chrysoperla carnea]|uniref:cadherin-23 n=1 Tax=Chrysoperla carnea TaxID=189513 RepID=UPI001D071A06|nr:cadherin-23 [Chrysoperla carnea]